MKRDHVRLAAMKKLCDLIESETGMKCFRGRQVLGTDIKAPFVNLVEAIRSGDTVQTNNQNYRNDRVDFLLSGYVDTKNVENPIDEAYYYMGRVEEALHKVTALSERSGSAKYPEWYNLGNTVSSFNYLAPVCHSPSDEVHGKSYFYIYLNFHVAYTPDNPYVPLLRR